jgi:type II secretory pathway predicted ATPase ExeA
MYEAFYGLRERPFDLVPNPRFLFLAGRQREALSNLRYGLTTARGLTLLLGEAGTGKTTMLETVVGELTAEGIRFVRLSNPTLTRPEFYEFLARTFGLPDEAVDSKTRFLFALRRELQERHAAGVLTALIIDEAQSVPYELLEEIRLLSNIETTTTKLLNVVLAGQPELADRLNEASLRQLKQRISLRCELRPMDMSETASYIAGRLRIAGGRPEQIFTREAVGAVFEASQGIPRTVNVVADNALIGGFAAQVRPISVAFIEEVRRDFDLKPVEPVRPETESQEPPAAPTAAVAQFPSPGSTEQGRGDEVAEAPMFGTVRRKRRFSFF